MKTTKMLTILVLALGLFGSAKAGWVPSRDNMYADVSGNVGIGFSQSIFGWPSPSAKLHVGGSGYTILGENYGNDGIAVYGYAGGNSSFRQPVYVGLSHRYGGYFVAGSVVSLSPTFALPGIGIYATGNFLAADFDGEVRIKGNVTICSESTGETVMELGEGLDFAEGFDVSGENKIEPGNVLIIDPANPGKLTISRYIYDKKVAGIVAGGKGLGSGVRLGVGQFDCNVALAGRVYCNVDATEIAIEPGDLLTTSPRPGFAMKALDYARARGAILGKAMEKLEKGKKGQILVLVTLQ